ncbi:metallophosphoesterase family protein [Stieleria sp. ICT_E10.1]|uniref:metallophosphoesterase family protein n=1 Tax=Stieleria sedimenti TaxID=2976331 RepID=UPI00217FACC4|nr:metallophosphoesterase family protein [Stieleria sedimenti]MCS7468304.1 metallophosphoesterase family protein [Stieleria sedimenti]
MTRTAILSDIHGNLTALQAVLAHVQTQQVDRIVCLGDVVGYGPQPCECLDVVMEFGFCVLGNHDSSALFDPEGFNAAAEQAIFWTRSKLENHAGAAAGDDQHPSASRRRLDFLCRLPRTIREENVLFVHGSPRGPTNEYVMPEDIQNSKKMEKLFSLVPHLCFQGHTHVPGIFTTDLNFIRPAEVPEGYDVSDPSVRLMINVGSVGQPRDLDPRSCYVVYDQQQVFFHRVEYDIEDTIAKIEAETELDNFLGYRLRDGR